MDYSGPLSLSCYAKTDHNYLTASAGLASDHSGLIYSTQSGVLLMLPCSRQLGYYHCMQFGVHFCDHTKHAHSLTTLIRCYKADCSKAIQIYQTQRCHLCHCCIQHFWVVTLTACIFQSDCLIQPRYLASLTNHLHRHAAAALHLCCQGPGDESPALWLTHHQAAQTSMSETEPPCLRHHLHTLHVCHDVKQPAQADGLSCKVCTLHGSICIQRSLRRSVY